jgi:hypothetical protein
MNAPLTARRATAIAKAAVPGVRFRSETRAAGVIRVTLIESLDAGRDLRAAQAAFLQSGYGTARPPSGRWSSSACPPRRRGPRSPRPPRSWPPTTPWSSPSGTASATPTKPPTSTPPVG